ncbi:MAG: tetratricopeptide repeat protein [Deltaproteobacteria bacterium]|nr:tetratricopeptide repeat protein [Deltaproteobacteria bacterium]
MKRLLLVPILVLWPALASADMALDFYREGVKLGNENKVEEALSKFQKSVMLEPKVFMYQLKLGYAYEMLGRLPEARATYEAALRLRGGADAFRAHNGLGNVLRRTRLFDLAEAEYLTVLKSKPKFADAMNGLGVLYAETERFDKAAEWYAKSFKADPKDEEAAFKAANVSWRMKKYDDAIGWYRKAIDLKPDYIDARFGLGLALKEKGDTEGAKVELKKACDGGVKQACKHLFQL